MDIQFSECKGCICLVCGIPGSGKSVLARKLSATKHPFIRMIYLDVDAFIDSDRRCRQDGFSAGERRLAFIKRLSKSLKGNEVDEELGNFSVVEGKKLILMIEGIDFDSSHSLVGAFGNA
ncbi:hypothetical protein ACOME3_007743 [Neoechinorhynchus agilis]